MATVNERLAALEAAIKSSVVPTTTTTTIYSAGAPTEHDAQQDARLAALEQSQESLAASVVSLEAAIATIEADYATATALAALEARVEVLEDKPGGNVDYVRGLSSSIGDVGAENIVTTVTTNEYSAYYDLMMAQSSLVGYWRMGETSGSTAADAKSGYTATWTGSYHTPTAGAIVGDSNGAVAFTGVGSYATTASGISALNLTSNFTLMCWVYCDTHGGANGDGGIKAILGKGTANSYSLSVGVSGDVRLYNNSGSLIANTGTNYLPLDTWVHVAATWAGGTTGKIYFNGVDKTVNTGTTTLAGNTDAMQFAGEGGAFMFMAGDKLDELAVFNTVLSQYTIQQIYAGTGGGGGGGGGGAGYITVASIDALLNALADNSIVDITVADGTYAIPYANPGDASSLYIGSRFAARTNAVLVHAATSGGVTFTRSGGSGGWLRFDQGARYQTWQGFVFANGSPTQTGVIFFGGTLNAPPPHHITLLDIELLDTIVKATVQTDHAIYFSYSAAPGVHDILIDGLVSNAVIEAGLHFYHSATGNPNANNVTLRNSDINGANMAIMLWDPTLSAIHVENTTIDNSGAFGVYHNSGSGITFDTVVTTGSGIQGFYSEFGTYPNVTGVTFTNCTFDT